MNGHIVSINGEITALLVKAMGMQAENMQRAHNGHAMAYSDERFNAVAEEIQNLSNQAWAIAQDR